MRIPVWTWIGIASCFVWFTFRQNAGPFESERARQLTAETASELTSISTYRNTETSSESTSTVAHRNAEASSGPGENMDDTDKVSSVLDFKKQLNESIAKELKDLTQAVQERNYGKVIKSIITILVWPLAAYALKLLPASPLQAMSILVFAMIMLGVSSSWILRKFFPSIIDHVSPTSGSISGGGWTDVHGTNFAKGQDVMFGNVRALETEFISSTKLRAHVPPMSKPGFVQLGLNGHGYSSCQYEYVVPTITLVSPSSGSISGGGWTDVHGTNFAEGQEVMFGNVRAPKTVFISSTKLRAHVPPMPQPGFVQLGLNGHGYSSCQYEYVVPRRATRWRLLPSGENGDTTAIITGEGFREGEEVLTGLGRTEFISSTELRFHLAPSSEPGSRGLSYEFRPLDSPFIPRVTGILPASGSLAGGNLVIVFGEGFIEGHEVLIGGKVATVVAFGSDTALVVRVPPSAVPGPVPVVIKGTECVAGADPPKYTYEELPSQISAVSEELQQESHGDHPAGGAEKSSEISAADDSARTRSQISAVSEELQQESHGDHPAGGAEKASEISAADDSTADDSARTRAEKAEKSRSANSKPKYCFCQCPESGDMVACDNPKCRYKWFHWECVDLDTAPTSSKWFCPECQKKLKASPARKSIEKPPRAARKRNWAESSN